MSTHPLCPHPETPCAGVRTLEVDLQRDAEGRLRLRYVLTGELARLRIPPQQPSRRADKLWQHTCFEAFVATAGMQGYAEFNFAPSCEWAAYRFNGYRAGMAPLELPNPPRVVVERRSDRLLLRADLHPGAHGDLRLALSAVIEAADGSLSYWALRHPAGKPDFHHADGFALRLGPATSP